MRTGEPSQTAQRAALRRAAHQLLDGPQLVFADPLALPFAGVDDPARLLANLRRGQNGSYRRLRAFLVARSRFMEDHLQRALASGVRQYVLLGAGLDTSPYRIAFPSGTAVFEVDHPATQQWKRERVRAAGLAEATIVRYVPVDFERQTWRKALIAAGFDAERPAFVAWLGVTVYLTPAAVLESLEMLSGLAPGTEVVFDYAAESDRLSAPVRAALAAMMGRMERLGEPWLSFFVPATLHRELELRGFQIEQDLDSAGINVRYFSERADGLHTEGIGHLLHARLRPRRDYNTVR